MDRLREQQFDKLSQIVKELIKGANSLQGGGRFVNLATLNRLESQLDQIEGQLNSGSRGD